MTKQRSASPDPNGLPPCYDMSVSLEIYPFSSTLHMYGEASSSFAFSLAGYVTVSITPFLSFFGRSRLPRILLQSLVVTFEGNSEVITPLTGYASVRLCSITRELVRGDPIELSDDAPKDLANPCSWNIVFDIPIPGWLPVTSTYSDIDFEETGSRYALYATATYLYPEDNRSPFSLSTLCSPFRSRSYTTDASKCPVVLQRVVESPTAFSDESALTMFVVETHPESNDAQQGPPDVFATVEVIASVPAAIPMNETSLPFALRLRAKDLADCERKRLRVTEFSIDVEQFEVYRNTTNQTHLYRFPIPPRGRQPPSAPLRDPHPIHTLYDAGALVAAPPRRSYVERKFSLLPENSSGRYIIGGDACIFATTSGVSEWYILEVDVPIADRSCEADWAGPHIRRITENGPLFSVDHILRVAVQCEYDDPTKEELVHKRLQFSLPLQLVHLPHLPALSLGRDASDAGLPMETQTKMSSIPPLPAYSQLFYPNGERKIDSSTPLPLYEPPILPSSPSSPLIEDSPKAH